jgi:hypothetical protein
MAPSGSMIGNILTNGPTYFVILIAALLIAACFAYNISRSFRTGRIYTYRGHVYRERKPIAFWLFVVLNLLIVVTLAADPVYIVWTHSSGR